MFREVAPGRPDPRARKGREIDVNAQALGIPIRFTCSLLARRWGRDVPALLARLPTNGQGDRPQPPCSRRRYRPPEWQENGKPVNENGDGSVKLTVQ